MARLKKVSVIILLAALLWPVLPTKIALAATPVINTIADDRTTQGTTYTKAPTLSAGGTVTWSKAYGPDDLTVNSTTGAVSWAIPASLPSESFHIGVKATNADGSDTEVWVLTVGNGTVRYVGPSETYTSISAATAASSSGDTIIIKDGAYTGASNAMTNNSLSRGTMPPKGSAGIYTTVIAETPGNVTLDGQGARNMLFGFGSYIGRVPATDNIVSNYDLSYIAFKGLVVTGNSSDSPIFVNRVHHIKFIDCGAYSTTTVSDDGGIIEIFRSQYVLTEGCYTWGRSRYQIVFYICDHVIMRRMVARLEGTNTTGPIGMFSFYACQYARGEDLIAVDGTLNATNYSNLAGALMNNRGGFSPANPADVYILDVVYHNAVVLNNDGPLGGTQSGLNDDPVRYYNIVAWGNRLRKNTPSDTNAINLISAASKLEVDQSTFGGITSPEAAVNVNSIFNGWNDNQSINRSIIANARNYDNSPMGVFYAIETASYDNVYNCGTLNTGSSNTDHLITSNPWTNGLRYLPRIESGSSLATAGSGGSRVGADLTYFWGKSGTLWGETGYDSQTSAAAWPWPHEDVIKTKMSAYPSTGTRGFCAAGNGLYGGSITLTSYIWEYLGSACPNDVCPVVAASASLQGDLNGDNMVNIFDYNIILSNFGNTQCGNVADIDSNCNVNIFDYNLLLSHFGQSL